MSSTRIKSPALSPPLLALCHRPTSVWGGTMIEVNAYIDDHVEESIALLGDYVKLASVSAQKQARVAGAARVPTAIL